MRTRVCIYCLQEKPLGKVSRGGGFDREHVLPEAMGVFENNLTLHNTVCKCCNEYCGKTIEAVLGHDSFESLLRIEHQVKSAASAQKLRWINVRLRLAGPGVWRGLQVRLEEQNGRLVHVPLPQVGLRKEGDDHFSYFNEDEIQDQNNPLPEPLAPKDSIFVVGRSEADHERLIELLARRGIRFRASGFHSHLETSPDEWIEIEAQIDESIRRAITKIAFNYLAKVTERTPEFALLPEFNPVREFVLRGTAPPSPIVTLSTDPVLFGDTETFRQTQGHLLTVGWHPNSNCLTAKVSLFNALTYAVVLCPSFSGIWTPLRSGHHFDIVTRRVTRMAYLP